MLPRASNTMTSRGNNIHRFFHKKESASDYLAERVEALRLDLAGADPKLLAANTGAGFERTSAGDGQFRLPFWGQDVLVPFPEFRALDAITGEPLDIFSLALLAYYFHTTDGTPPTGSWIAFSELPDGRFYAQAFQSYTGARLSDVFGNDVDALANAAQRLDGRPESFGDRAYSFQVLPRLPLMLACWLGDEDFPSSYRILFDRAAGHHLTTDACAIVGSSLTRRLIAARDAE